MTRYWRVVSVALMAMVLAACGGGDPTTGDAAPSTAKSVATDSAVERTVAIFNDSLQVLAEPHGKPGSELPQRNAAGAKTVLLVKQIKGDWTELYLPTRPNGSTGWVENDQLEYRTVRWRIEVRLKARLVEVYEAGKLVISGPAAVGKASTPTPVGTFFVTENVRPGGGPYGSVALGLSAHSEVLKSFGAGGDGQVAIHATNDHGSIGKAVSHGCVRVDDTVAEVLEGVPAGTPVTIRQ